MYKKLVIGTVILLLAIFGFVQYTQAQTRTSEAHYRMQVITWNATIQSVTAKKIIPADAMIVANLLRDINEVKPPASYQKFHKAYFWAIYDFSDAVICVAGNKPNCIPLINSATYKLDIANALLP